MFDLDHHVRAWRAAVSNTFAANCLDELEAHLRDEFDRLTAAGSPPDQAWQASLNSLGNPKALATEFAKLAPSPRWLKMIPSFKNPRNTRIGASGSFGRLER